VIFTAATAGITSFRFASSAAVQQQSAAAVPLFGDA
jgi:hypothetical protein